MFVIQTPMCLDRKAGSSNLTDKMLGPRIFTERECMYAEKSRIIIMQGIDINFV